MNSNLIKVLARLGGCLLLVFVAFPSGAETIRITDDFERSATTYQTSEDIPNAIGSNYTVTDGRWRIQNNALVSNLNPSRMYENTLQTLNSGTDRFVLSADVKVSDGRGNFGGILCNVQDGLNYYALRYAVNGPEAVLQFIKTVDGVNNLIGPGSIFITDVMSANTYYTLTISSSNNTFNFSISEVDGAEITSGTATDSTFTGGYGGVLRQGGGAVMVNKFSIESTAEAVERRTIEFATGFNSGIVLRADYANIISGTATPGERVTVEINRQLKETSADDNWNWQVVLDPESSGGPYVMTAEGANSSSAAITDVYFGALPVELSAIISNGCVLQRDRPVALWGTGASGETITVQIKDQSNTSLVDGNGNWQVTLEPEPAGGPYPLTISGTMSLSIELADVYYGDVWILTGQSNMFQTLAAQMSAFPDEYPVVPNDTDDFDDVRLAIVAIVSDLRHPRKDVTMHLPWSRWEPEALPDMSTIGYFFTRFLKEQLESHGLGDIPLGIIKVCKGGTSIEEWISNDKLVASGLPLPSNASGHYNGMIAPIQNYAITGALWYQGESNATSIGKISRYPALKEILVDSWREQWNHPYLPLFFVQLAPYHAHSALMKDSELWPWMREAQLQCLSIANTAMACSIDGGLQGDIHPPFKDRLGERLARIALSETYGLPFQSRGPVVKNVQIDGSDVIITFDHVADGLRTQAVNSENNKDEITAGFLPVSVSSDELAGFALCGSDQTFYWATQAEIISPNQVRISNRTDVPQPKAVRYAWQNFPRCNLFNSEGLPAEPFRSDDYGYNTSTAANSTRGAMGND
jgi:sialate O-acetylesterase